MTRAHAREDSPATPAERKAAGLHKLRKGRDQCAAHRRDGLPCLAPAVAGALTCRRHGAAAFQVRVSAQLFLLRMEAYTAVREWEETRGTWREPDAIGRWSVADRDLKEFEFKLGYLRALRADVRQLEAAAR
jgi:hypothetical protein